jgi:hypothetical protein
VKHSAQNCAGHFPSVVLSERKNELEPIRIEIRWGGFSIGMSVPAALNTLSCRLCKGQEIAPQYIVPAVPYLTLGSIVEVLAQDCSLDLGTYPL